MVCELIKLFEAGCMFINLGEHCFPKFLAGHAEGCIVWTGVNTAWCTADALALIASCRFLLYDWNLVLAVAAKTNLMPVHGDVSIWTIGRALPTADAVILDHNLL